MSLPTNSTLRITLNQTLSTADMVEWLRDYIARHDAVGEAQSGRAYQVNVGDVHREGEPGMLDFIEISLLPKSKL